jgi:RNA polymerase sigma factor (sigma-70 family)
MNGNPSTLKARSADSVTVEALARGHHSSLLRYFKKRGVRDEDAEDAVQEVFVRLSRRQGLSEIEGIEGYLFETAANVAIDAHRHNRVRHFESHVVYDDSQHGRSDSSCEAVFEGQEAIEQLLLALRELSDRTRTIFILARLEHMKQSEIAQRLGISVSAVEKQLTKGLAYLAQRTSMP